VQELKARWIAFKQHTGNVQSVMGNALPLGKILLGIGGLFLAHLLQFAH